MEVGLFQHLLEDPWPQAQTKAQRLSLQGLAGEVEGDLQAGEYAPLAVVLKADPNRKSLRQDPLQPHHRRDCQYPC